MNSDVFLEINILGNIIHDVSILYRFEGIDVKYFADPFHQRLFATIQALEVKKSFSMTNLLHEFDSTDRSYILDLYEKCVLGIDTVGAMQLLIQLWENRETVRYLKKQLELLETEKKCAREILEEISQQKITHQEAKDQSAWLSDCMVECAQEIEEWDANSGLKTELYWLDSVIKGFFPADLIVIGGLTGKGKTALAATIAYNIAAKGKHVMFFSMEMKKTQLTYRILSRLKERNISNRNVMSSEGKRLLSSSIRNLASELSPSKLVFKIDDTPAIKLSTLRQRILRFNQQFKLDFVVVDFLTLMTAEDKSFKENKAYQLDSLVYGLKGLAKELNIAILLLCQLSREAERLVEKQENGKKVKIFPKPQLSHFRETAGIGFAADIALIIHDPDTQDEEVKENSSKRKIEIHVIKNRYGSLGKTEFLFNGPLTLIENLP